MNPQKIIVTAAAWLLAGSSLLGQPQPAPNLLYRPSETILFSFITSRGKTVMLCEGPKSAYLVYRFGTAAKVELQYPAVLDASSWQKFTYSWYTRGGGLANAGRSEARLSFRNGKVGYELYDSEHAEAGKNGEEVYLREVGIDVSVGASISGDDAATGGSLWLSPEQKERVTMSENSF